MNRDHAYLAALATVLATVAVSTAQPATDKASATVAADRFVDTAGVNIHLHYDNTLYRTQFPLIRSRLIELGVRHVRDGLEDTTWQGYYERHNALGEAGIKGTFITAPEQSTAVWAAYPARVSKTFEAYEAPNEYDKSRKPNWVQILTDTLKRLRSLRDMPGLEDFPVYGPSLTTASAYTALGDVSAYYDFANLHNYFSGRHPGTRGWGANGYGSIAWNLDLAVRYGGGKPTVTTETGYQDVSTALDPVPPEIAGRYVPRLLLEQYRAGIVRTFLYELCDFPRSGGYGLLEQDGTPKPAFTAVKSLLNLLADPGPSFTPRDLSYSLVGATGDLRDMTFQKRSGKYYLVLWLSVAGWDPVTRQHIEPKTQNIIVNFVSPMRILRTHRWQANGSVSAEAVLKTTSTFQVNVTDALTIVEVAPAGTGRLIP